MKRGPKHVQIYYNHFGYSEGDLLISEISGLEACQIHHVSLKGMGGSKLKNSITNLMAVTFGEHEQLHNRKKPYISEEEAQSIHNKFMRRGAMWT